jgi:16S rRNA processing protein RimM
VQLLRLLLQRLQLRRLQLRALSNSVMAGMSIIGRKAVTLDDLQQVAQVLKSNGTDGELVMGFREIAPEDINLQEPVFIIFDGLPVPFYIESFTKRGNTKALVRLTDIRSMEDVEEIAGKAVYIEAEEMPELSLEEDGYAALVGWMVLTPEIPDQAGDDDMALIEVGEITDFLDIPNNPCIEVETENGAVMLPLHEDFILGLDPEYQEIIMQIPAGLLS